MNRNRFFLSVAFCFLLAFPPMISHAELSFPEPEGYVNDFANILSSETEEILHSLAAEIQQNTNAELAIVTIDSLEGYEPNYYAVELGRSWQVGTAERDDGIVFLTAVNDRKTYIATGYGVESYITDAQAFWISDQVVVPYFRNGDYDAGILAGAQEIKAALVDLEILPDGYAPLNDASSDFTLGDWGFIIIFISTFIFPWLAAVFGRSKRWWPGGVVGGIIGALLISLFALSLWIIFPLVFFGLLFDYLASKNYKNGIDKWWTGGGSSGWGGGSSGGWGSGSSGGGFGGFSGGSFGGGGGGSSW